MGIALNVADVPAAVATLRRSIPPILCWESSGLAFSRCCRTMATHHHRCDRGTHRDHGLACVASELMSKDGAALLQGVLTY